MVICSCQILSRSGNSSRRDKKEEEKSQTLFVLFWSGLSPRVRTRRRSPSALDVRLLAVLLLVVRQHIERDARPAAHLEHHVPPRPLVVAHPLPESPAQLAAVADGQGGSARRFDEQPRVVGEAHAADGCIGVGHGQALEDVGPVARPLPCAGGHARGAECGGDGGDGGEGDVLARDDAGVETIGADGLDGEDPRLLLVRRVEGCHALHDAVEQTASADADHDAVHGSVAHLVLQLGHQARGSVPDERVVERRHVHALGIVGQQLLPQIAIRLRPVVAPDLDADAQREEFALHEGRRGRREDDCGGAREGERRSSAGEARVAAGGTVEVHILGRRGGGEGADHEVADAARLEGAAGLEVIQLEIDIAGGVVSRKEPQEGGERSETHHPATRESSGLRTRGVLIQGILASEGREPMADAEEMGMTGMTGREVEQDGGDGWRKDEDEDGRTMEAGGLSIYTYISTEY